MSGNWGVTFVPVDLKKPGAKNTLSFQPDSRGMWMPNYKDPCVVIPVTTNVDEPACRCSQEILCQNIQKSVKSKNQKSKSSMSREPEKAT